MKPVVLIALAATAVVGAVASSASAQTQDYEESYTKRSVRAPRDAFEMTLSSGYTQGFGDIAGNNRIGDIAEPGYGVGLGLGFRVLPHLTVGLVGHYQEFSPRGDLNEEPGARGVATGVEGTYHFTPYDRFDLWLLGGIGYRFLWDVRPNEPNNTLHHGVQIARLQVGFDWRLARRFALGPFVGADATAFLGEDDNSIRGTGGDRGLNNFVYGGLQARFDIGGRTEGPYKAAIGSR